MEAAEAKVGPEHGGTHLERAPGHPRADCLGLGKGECAEELAVEMNGCGVCGSGFGIAIGGWSWKPPRREVRRTRPLHEYA